MTEIFTKRKKLQDDSLIRPRPFVTDWSLTVNHNPIYAGKAKVPIYDWKMVCECGQKFYWRKYKNKTGESRYRLCNTKVIKDFYVDEDGEDVSIFVGRICRGCGKEVDPGMLLEDQYVCGIKEVKGYAILDGCDNGFDLPVGREFDLELLFLNLSGKAIVTTVSGTEIEFEIMGDAEIYERKTE